MNKPSCPCCISDLKLSGFRPSIKHNGRYYRRSDRKWIRKFRCGVCGKYFSIATSRTSVRQKKRHLNSSIEKLFVSGVSQRRIAKLLRISRTTVVRKFQFIAAQAEERFKDSNAQAEMVATVEFDDLETFEHTKCKPLSVTLAVEASTRRILGFAVSQMPAKGLLTRQAMKKYGPRKDKRYLGRAELFLSLLPLVSPTATIKSDENPHYPGTVRRFFPNAKHETFKGQRGSIVGQGELKKIRFDPLFSLNHTCAMLRANINRLFRRTWCTTKKPERLRMHIAIYAAYHNNVLIKATGGGPVPI